MLADPFQSELSLDTLFVQDKFLPRLYRALRPLIQPGFFNHQPLSKEICT